MTENIRPPVRRRILLVDDHLDTNIALKILLERRGYDVVTADSSASALACSREERFDLVISDIGLPDGSGWDLLPQLLSMQPVKAIALSGFATKDDIERSQRAGFSFHLPKPFSFPELHAIIRQLTE